MKLAAMAALGLSSSLVYARLIEPNQLDIVELPILIYNLPLAFDGYRIVQFSDIHMDGTTMTRQRLAEIVEVINAQQPDMIAFTGDFVTGSRNFRLQDLIMPLRGLHAPDGVFSVMGNHDHRVPVSLIRTVVYDSGMIDLDNTVRVIQRDDALLYIAGIDSLLRHKARLDLVMEQIPDGATAILLAHEPDFADLSGATGRFALQLSGHSHGGQICVPLLTKFALPCYGERYVSGVHQIEEMVVYTNRGLGTVGLPLRFNCLPEITVFTLRSAAQLGFKTPAST